MKIINSLNGSCAEDCAVALGYFDGLHLAHTQIIKNTVEYAQKNGLRSAVFSLSGNPKNCKRLLTDEAFYALTEKLNVDYLIKPEFNSVKHIEAEDFFDILTLRFGANAFFCGYNYHFGKMGRGDAALLQRLCGEKNIGCVVLPMVEFNGDAVSSTRIRSALLEGDVISAAKMLGRPFGYDFPVVAGNKIGHLMGTPTINQIFPDDFCVPKYGVYASAVCINGKIYNAVTNIGVKPTVGAPRPLSETWIADFDGDLYGKNVAVCLIEFLRPEQKFGSIEQLRAAILKDAERAQKTVINIKW